MIGKELIDQRRSIGRKVLNKLVIMSKIFLEQIDVEWWQDGDI